MGSRLRRPRPAPHVFSVTLRHALDHRIDHGLSSCAQLIIADDPVKVVHGDGFFALAERSVSHSTVGDRAHAAIRARRQQLHNAQIPPESKKERNVKKLENDEPYKKIYFGRDCICDI